MIVAETTGLAPKETVERAQPETTGRGQPETTGLAQRRRGAETAENEIGRVIIGAAIELHQELGPGLFESVYEMVLADLLRRSGLQVERQVPIGVEFRGIRFDEGFRVDMIVEKKVIVELKCLARVHAAHEKQLLTYLRLTGLKLGYILNFNEALMKHGVTRIVNHLGESG